jgi:aminopeptidase
MSDLTSRLERYARLAVKVGLNVQPGQRVFIRATRGEPEFVHLVVRAAYRTGASLVHVLWEDDAVDLIRVQESSREGLEHVIDWYALAYNGAAERGDAMLLLHSPDPELFAGVDPERVGVNRQTRLRGLKPMLQAQSRNAMQWSVCRVPTEAGAKRVFPEDTPTAARDKLWDVIFAVCRIDAADPIAAWQSHVKDLSKRAQVLMEKQYLALHFTGPNTNLTLGLPTGHTWIGADSKTESGVPFVANIPTEEVFTLPHRDMADGHVTVTRPLSLGGVLIHHFSLTFEHGKVTKVAASNAQDVLERLIATDEGACRPGEIALVSASNPIARMNRVFYDGLLDENAASHLALGRAYRISLKGGAQMSKEDFREAGGNDSLIHEDLMIGSSEMDVDGILPDGRQEPLMRGGEWTLKV